MRIRLKEPRNHSDTMLYGAHLDASNKNLYIYYFGQDNIVKCLHLGVPRAEMLTIFVQHIPNIITKDDDTLRRIMTNLQQNNNVVEEFDSLFYNVKPEVKIEIKNPKKNDLFKFKVIVT